MTAQRNDHTDEETVTHLTNRKGHMVPIALVKPDELLEHEVVMSIHAFALDLMAQIARFRAHTYDDLTTLMELKREKYGIVPRGMKEGGRGNVSFTSYDGGTKAEISVQDYVDYGAELQIAKELVDQYISEVSEGVSDEVHVLLNHAFDVDKKGKVNRQALYTLRSLNIDHPTWLKAMQAITDSQRVQSTREFIRISERNDRGGYSSLPIDLANAREVK